MDAHFARMDARFARQEELYPFDARLRLAAADLTGEQRGVLTPLGGIPLPADMLLHRFGPSINLVKDGYKGEFVGPMGPASASPITPGPSASPSGASGKGSGRGTAATAKSLSPADSGSPSSLLSLERQTSPTPTKAIPGVSCFAFIGFHVAEVNKLAHACARGFVAVSSSETCYVGRVGDAPPGLKFFADKAWVMTVDGQVLVAHVSVRPAWDMRAEDFSTLLTSFFGSECTKVPFCMPMKAAGSKPPSPRGRDDDFVKPVAVCPSTGDPKNRSPDVIVTLAPEASDVGALIYHEKASAFAPRSLARLLDAAQGVN